jgi:hypothetical protein
MIKRAADALKAGKFLNEFIPIPEQLEEATASYGDEYKDQNEKNVAETGYASWYDFCVNEWGTKWDVESYGEPEVSESGLSLEASFDSAWAPPIEAYRKLEEMGFTINALYYEPGMGFCGQYDIDSGDDVYEIPGTADDAEAEIPEHINEAFGISENMRAWEEEQIEDDE